MKNYYVYILECNDFSLYTGYTTDPKRRLKEHNQKKASKYTRGRTPVKMVYLEKIENKTKALQREYEIKTFSKSKKLQLIKSSKEEPYEPRCNENKYSR